MPHGRSCAAPVACCSATAAQAAECNIPPTGSGISSDGIRYSNIEPDQDFRPAVTPTERNGRPSEPQWRRGTSPLAIASKLVRRASDASKS